MKLYTWFVVAMSVITACVIVTNVMRKSSRPVARHTVKCDSVGCKKVTITVIDSMKFMQDYVRKDVKCKGLYLSGWTVGSLASINKFVRLASATEINTYVVDIKDDDGFVGYRSSVPSVLAVDGWMKKYNVDRMVKAFHDNGIYIIGRVVCFKDPLLASRKLDLAIKSKNGGVWRDPHGRAWLNPYNREAWAYIVAVAREGVSKGFDEIQFDYVRFANDGDISDMDFSAYKETKHEVIDKFLAYVHQQLPGVKLSADVFGIICESPGDVEGIGQELESVGKDIDCISPMVYPSHYALGQTIRGIHYQKPDLDPYGVVYNSLVKAKGRIAQVAGYKATVRPFLQDFTAKWLDSGNYMKYGAGELRLQIKAVYDAGYDEWLVWNASNRYSESAFVIDEKK